MSATLLLLACGGSPPEKAGAEGAGPATTVAEHASQPRAVATSERMPGQQNTAMVAAQPGAAAAPFPTAANAVPPGPSTAKLSERLVGFLQKWAKREAAFVETYKATFTGELAKLRWFKKLSSGAYQARNYALAFSDGTKLIAGTPMLEALKHLESHGLDPKPYNREGIQTLVGAVDKASGTYNALLADTGGPKQAALWKVLDALRGRTSITSVQLDAMLAKHQLSDVDLPAMAGLEKRTDTVFAAKAAVNTAFIKLDLALTQAYLRYAYEMRYRKVAHPFEADTTYGRGLERSAEALLERYKRTKFDGNFAQVLADLQPQIPEYNLLRKELRRYEELAAANNQVKLASIASRLRPRSKGRFVVELQKRLKQEGYYNGEIHPVYDEALAEAVTLYQTTHQLKIENGKMSYSTRKSMNKSYGERAAEIRLSLQRHRESELHQNPDFAFGKGYVQARVNIPAFEATFFKGGKAIRKHNVVVGNNAVEVHERTGLKGHFNRTRLFSKRLKTVVLNPVWRVPPRIKEQELDKSLIEEPDFYAKNNYKVKILADGTEQVTQMPGPKNALGLVKFLFPNQFSIYMHDTNKKRLFGRTIRAFSHGCMRVENALDLAKFVLLEVEGMSKRKYERALKARKTYAVKLKKDVPITIDYNTVGVHEETGKAMFYADIYKFDRDYLAGKTPYKRYPHRGMEQAVVLAKKGVQ